MKLILLACLLIDCVASKSFDGFKVFKLTPTTKEQMNFLSMLEREDLALDFWKGINNAGIPIDVMVGPQDQKSFLERMDQNGIHVEEMIDDVQKRIKAETMTRSLRNGLTRDSNAETMLRSLKDGLTWDNYYTLEDIHSWLDRLASENPNVSIISSGKSYEGRDIKGVKVSFKDGNRGVFIEGGIHAREWISPATVTYIINELVNSNDPAFRSIAESFDWYIFPSINPDGYSFTHSSDRLWRKNRTPYGKCYGADVNRNWASHWGENGTSTRTCAEIYGGPKAFSELESSGMAAFIRTIGSSLDVFLSFHSYGPLLLIPYGHTTVHLDNYEDVKKIGLAVSASLAARYGTNYTVGNTAEVLYAASGCSVDWVKQEFKTPIVFTYELRDSGTFGFILPADQIIPNCKEVMDSLVTLFTEGEKLGYLQIGNKQK